MLLIALLHVIINLIYCSEWQFESSLVELNSHLHRKIVNNPSRPYGIFVLYTTLNPKYNCPLCVLGSENIKKIAAILQSKKVSSIRLALIQAEQGEQVFRELGIESVPILSWYPSSKTVPIKQSNLRQIGNIDDMQEWIGEISGIKLKSSSDFPLITSILILLLVSLTILFSKFFVKLITDSRTYMFITMTFITIIMAGQMWNKIKNAWTRGQNGELFYGNLQTQFAYLVMGIIVISLAKQIPRVRGKLAQTIIVILLSGLLLIGYALELKFFRIKAPVYPLKVIL